MPRMRLGPAAAPMCRAACRTLAVVLMLGALSACATVTTGSSDNVTVETDPVGAACEFRRGGELVGAVNPTPGSVSISKSTSDMVLTCKRAGYFDSSEDVSAEFQGMTLGNLILGGLVGIAVDAASGAMGNYPDSVQVSLVPTKFTSADERDGYFARLRKKIEDRANKKIKEVKDYCDSNNREACDQEVKTLQEKRDKLLARLGDQLERATIDPNAPSASTMDTGS